jgi:SAM-dependent methyltransferase
MRSTRNKENLALRQGERWRPPIFEPVATPRARLMAAVRRFFDLQAGTLWTDLKPALSAASGTVVDVGCGAQPYRGLLSADTRYVGLDTESADENFGYDVPDVLPIGSDGRWPLDDGSADLVLATETLEHVPDPPAFLAEARRVLPPGGRVIITVPFAARWHYIPHDYWRFTPSGIKLILEQAGFGEVVVHARGNERTVACYKLLALLLPAALPQGSAGAMRPGVRALLAAGPATLLAGLAQRSLRGEAGDDCLGYVVYATRAADQETSA